MPQRAVLGREPTEISHPFLCLSKKPRRKTGRIGALNHLRCAYPISKEVDQLRSESAGLLKIQALAGLIIHGSK